MDPANTQDWQSHGSCRYRRVETIGGLITIEIDSGAVSFWKLAEKRSFSSARRAALSTRLEQFVRTSDEAIVYSSSLDKERAERQGMEFDWSKNIRSKIIRMTAVSISLCLQYIRLAVSRFQSRIDVGIGLWRHVLNQLLQTTAPWSLMESIDQPEAIGSTSDPVSN